ncbi:MAG: hypothetical protein A2Y88_07095 [Chloroflexi bacterium RBG_13_48_10]|nr:MAG: hypothetical protein A2Y88_07095 [Chloroflexi bacterium RBG_13_48_10]
MPKVGREAPNEEHTQSVVFEKSAGWTEESSKKWCEEHDYYTDGFDETKNKFRYRQYEPDYEKFDYRNNEIEKGSISLVLGIPKNKAKGDGVRKERTMRHSYILDAFTRTPWAILPDKLAVLEEIVARHVSGEKMDPDEVQMVIHGAKRPDNRKAGNIAILPLFGTIFPRANLMTQVSGATSAEIFGEQFDELVNDPEISAIVLDVDSPGGQVAGIEELSRKIYDARGKKPIVAVANHTMASAAYWIGTSAEEVVISPSGGVGSIGVFAAHWDESAALEMDGLKLTLISEGKYKTEGNPYQPLTEEAHSAIRGLVKEAYDAFVKAVARNRDVNVDVVRDGFGEGRVVGSHQAVEIHMADRIGTLEDTVKQLHRKLFKLSDEDRQKADDLRIKVNQILQKEK